MTTDTPRTDAYNNSLGVVPASFSRQLERELTETREWLDERYKALSEADQRAEKAEGEVERLNGLLSDLLILTEKQYWNSTNYKQIKIGKIAGERTYLCHEIEVSNIWKKRAEKAEAQVRRLTGELERAIYGCGCDNYLQIYCDKHNPYNK